MNQSQSARNFAIYIAKREYKSWQSEYRRAKEQLNAFKTPVCKSVSWSIFNHARNRYLKAIAQLRDTLRATA